MDTMVPNGYRTLLNWSNPIVGWVFVGCFVLLGNWNTLDAYAGCGLHGDSSANRLAPRLGDGRSSSGELGLPMYREYVGGKWSYSLVAPQPPCDGPGCRAKPSCRPLGVAVVPTETLVVTCFSELSGFGYLISPDLDWANVPASEFAFRGRLAPPEPPPKV